MAESLQIQNFTCSLDKYKCSICIDYLNNPILTRCGHKFCQSCINNWFQKQKACPICKTNLNIVTDIFPDECTKREVLELQVDCPNTENGCSIKAFISDLKEHTKMCIFQSNNDEDGQFLCQFDSVGCKQIFKCKKELEDHLKDFLEHHLRMMGKAFNELKMSAYYNDKLMKQEKARVEELSLEVQKMYTWPIEKLFYSGHLLWHIDDFNNKIEKGFSIESPVFYSSPLGYKFNLVCKYNGRPISSHNSYLDFSIYLLPTEYHNILKWPCRINVCSVSFLTSLNKDAYRWIGGTSDVLVDYTNEKRFIFSERKKFFDSEFKLYIIDNRLWIKVNIDVAN